MANISLKEWTNRLKGFVNELEEKRNEECLRIAHDALALVKRRLINEKVDSKGEPLGSYSRAVVPFWFYKGKETNRDNAKAVQELYDKHGYFASYYDWRVVNNLPVDSINLSFTNKMWSKMAALIVESKLFKVVIKFEPTTEPERLKLGYHLERWPGLLQLNEKELNFVIQANRERRFINRLTKFKII